MSKEFLIWWLGQCDVELVLSRGVGRRLPAYILGQIRNCEGRNGRGRLWVPEGVGIRSVPWDARKKTCAVITERSCAGIVFRAADIQATLGLPGFVTDLRCNLYVP